MKTCSKCGVEKDEVEFKPYKYKDKNGNVKEGINGFCNQCFAKRKAILDKKYYSKNKEKLIAYQKQRRFGEKRDQIIKTQREYYKKVRGKQLVRNKLKRQTKEYKEYVKKYNAENRERIRVLAKVIHKKASKKRAAILSDSYVVEQILFSPYNTLTRQEIYNSPELIEIKRSQILISRIKRETKNVKKDY